MTEPQWDNRDRLVVWTFELLDEVYAEMERVDMTERTPIMPERTRRWLGAFSVLYPLGLSDLIKPGMPAPFRRRSGNPTFARDERARAVADVAKTIRILWQAHGCQRRRRGQVTAEEVAAEYCYRSAGLERDEDDIADLVDKAEAIRRKGPKRKKTREKAS